MNQENLEYDSRRPAASKSMFVAKLNRYRDLLARKWWVLTAGVAAGLSIAGGLWWFETPSFVSVGRMIVSIKLALPDGSVYNEELSNFLGTQAALMQSGVVLNRAHGRVIGQHPELAAQKAAVRVTVSPKTSIFVLETKSADPVYAREFLQAAMEEYIILKKEMRAQTSDSTVAGLTQEVLRLEQELRKSEEDVVEFQRSNSVALLQEQGNSAGNYLATLNQRLGVLKSERALLESLTLDQNLERRQEVGTDSTGRVDLNQPANSFGGELADTEYMKAKQQLLLLKAEQQDLGQYLRPKHPKMLALSEDIGRRERLLDIFRQQSAEQIESRKEALSRQIQNLTRDTQEWNARALEASQKTAEFQRLKSNEQRVQSLYDRLLATMQTLDLNKGINQEGVTILEPASQALTDGHRHWRQLALGGVLAAVLSVGLLLFLDHMDDRVNSLSELQELFDEPVMTQIPREKQGRQERALPLLKGGDERHAFLEAYRNLRSSLLFMNDKGQRPKTMVVTSSIPNEGKSLTACNLAITLAAANARVLLIDADLRKGVLHERFEVAVSSGLCEVLAHGVEWVKAVQGTRYGNLWLLPRGTARQDSSELFLAGGAMERLLECVASRYDYVLLDTPPVLAVDDVTNVAALVDTVLFVLRAEHTSGRVARAALELLYQRQAGVLGLVFNAVRPRSADYYYYSYPDHYGAYPAGGRQVK